LDFITYLGDDPKGESMTKVEELRQRLIDGRGFLTGTVSGLDSLIFTVDAEAFAKGVEEERERIRNAPDVTFVGGAAMNWHFDSRKWYIIPYSVLAPKEKP
jgi:hypothetical protein